ncbi:MAG: hypothetical protein QOF79_2156 [Actinomycetota bacterium]|jgi:hypothetical protein|nr:hypothetical protein [Actinomycetota bacterium]
MKAEQRFDQIVEDLRMLGVTAGSMFGARGAKADGKVFACLVDGAMSFKLGAESSAHARALALSGAELWDPSGMHRPFKDWVAVPFEHSDEWGHLAEAALHRLRQKL